MGRAHLYRGFTTATEPDEVLLWREVMRWLDELAVEVGLLRYAPDVDRHGRPIIRSDRAAVFAARKRLLDAWDLEHRGEPIMPTVADLDRLTQWWRAR